MILTHQDLLDAYVKFRLYNLGETTASYDDDWRDLITEVEKYAKIHGLSTACLDETRADLASLLSSHAEHDALYE